MRLYNRVLSDLDIANIATTISPFEQWRIAHHNPAQLGNPQLSGPFADPDQDGIEHLIEYALGLTPHRPDGLTSKITMEPDANQYLRLTVERNAAASDITYAVQVSDDMTNWSNSHDVILQNTSTTLQVRDTLPMSNHPKRFMRLRVTMP